MTAFYEIRSTNLGNSNTLFGIITVPAQVSNLKAQHEAAEVKARETFELKMFRYKLIAMRDVADVIQ